MFKKEDFIIGIQRAINIHIEMNKESILLKRIPREFDVAEENSVVVGEIPINEIIDLEQEFNNKSLDFKDSMLFANNYFEIAVETQDRFFTPRLRNDRNTMDSAEHNYSLSVSKGSRLYLYSLLCQFASNPLYVVLPNRIYSFDTISSIDEFFDFFRIITVKIATPKKTPIADFKRMLYSYIFNISYNKDLTLSPVDFTENRRTVRIRTRRNGQLFPYKTYNHELTKYYRQALATNIPFTQYLAFYHVAEYFFQSVSEQDAHQVIRDAITHPSFTPYKKDEINRFYNTIKKKIREQRDDGVWNERNGLILCLQKYVTDFDSLRTSIDTIDPNAIDYYKNNTVEFADGSKTINFDEDTNNIYLNIRDRVYSVRNAIVHSKEGDKLRYEPFKHDKLLSKEIALIRSIAEEIIIKSAKPMENITDESLN